MEWECKWRVRKKQGQFSLCIIVQCLPSTNAQQTPQNWQTQTFSFFGPNGGCQSVLILSTPLFLFLTMTEPRCIQGREQRYDQRKLLFWLRKPNIFFGVFVKSWNWPVWEMNSMFHIKSLCSNLNTTLWEEPPSSLLLPPLLAYQRANWR